MRRLFAVLLFLGICGGAAFWWLTAPQVPKLAFPDHRIDLANGERMFLAGGCSSCHAAPGAKGDDKLKLGGGLELNTPFGIFRVPNISPDPQTGIGGWNHADFLKAMRYGVSPDNQHYYPAFPYTSYARMKAGDLIDMKAYLETLPAVSNRVADHDLPFPFSVRRGLGLWKRLYLSHDPAITLAAADEQTLRGQYLVEGPGHCGECHTPRNPIGGAQYNSWLAGAPNPDGEGVIPNITPSANGLRDWAVSDIVYYLETGFTPDFDSVGGSMVSVQDNIAKLPAEDRQAIAAYLKAVTALPNGYKKAGK
jgi:mono/diheme cytochrome c family protein